MTAEQIADRAKATVRLSDGRLLADVVKHGAEFNCRKLEDLASYEEQVQARLVNAKLAVEFARASPSIATKVENHLTFVRHSRGEAVFACTLISKGYSAYILYNAHTDESYVDEGPSFPGRPAQKTRAAGTRKRSWRRLFGC